MKLAAWCFVITTSLVGHVAGQDKDVLEILEKTAARHPVKHASGMGDAVDVTKLKSIRESHSKMMAEYANRALGEKCNVKTTEGCTEAEKVTIAKVKAELVQQQQQQEQQQQQPEQNQACEPRNLAYCSEMERQYVAMCSDAGVEAMKKELKRLQGMEHKELDTPDREWTVGRINIIKKMTAPGSSYPKVSSGKRPGRGDSAGSGSGAAANPAASTFSKPQPAPAAGVLPLLHQLGAFFGFSSAPGPAPELEL
jgi:hypothetical protein